MFVSRKMIIRYDTVQYSTFIKVNRNLEFYLYSINTEILCTYRAKFDSIAIFEFYCNFFVCFNTRPK